MEKKDNNWKTAFFTTIISLVILFVLQVSFIFSYFNKMYSNKIYYQHIDNERTFRVLEKLITILQEKDIKLSKDQIESLYNERELSSAFLEVEIPQKGRKFTIGNVYFQFDENDILTHLRFDPYYRAVEDKWYDDTPIRKFINSQKNLFSSFEEGGTIMWFGILIFFIILAGIFYQLKFEFSNDYEKYRAGFKSIVIYFLVSIMISILLYLKFFNDLNNLESFLFIVRYVDASTILDSLKLNLIYPTFLFNLYSINILLFLLLLIRYSRFTKNKIKG